MLSERLFTLQNTATGYMSVTYMQPFYAHAQLTMQSLLTVTTDK